MDNWQGKSGGSLELGAQCIHGGSEENSVWREAKRAGLLGEVDEDEVGRVVDAAGNKVDEVLAEKAWQIYQQVDWKEGPQYRRHLHRLLKKLKNSTVLQKRMIHQPHCLSFVIRGSSNLQASIIYTLYMQTFKRNSNLNTGDDLDKLEPIVSSLLTVMAEYACDDLSKVTVNLVWNQL